MSRRVIRRADGATAAMFLGDDQARSRLALAAGMCAVTFVILASVINYVPLPSSGDLPLANLIAIANIALSLLVIPLAYSKRISSARLVDFALMYQVLQGLGICLAELYWTYDPMGTVRGVSWVCIWIIGFQWVVPSSPGKSLLAATATATMGPIALLIAIASGVPPISWVTAFYLVMPNYLAAGVAVLLSTMLFRLREDATLARQLGSYKMIKQLGSGGMGEVWHAEHDMLARPAAIKLINPAALAMRSKADVDTIFKRFQREAEATARLTSEHTVHVFDFGLSDDGTLFYVMELLDGTDLESMVEQHGALPPERVVHLLKQACESLAEAHERGLVHRDVKPANIFVCKLGSAYDRVKVLDFGLVSIQSQMQSQVTRLTGEGALTGTPAYMAPELISGDSSPDSRVDVYALGCVAYWLLTGQLVFPGETPLQAVFAHVEKEPVRPSVRATQTIPRYLEDLVLDCLAKDPDHRPTNAAELAKRLEACNVGEWKQSDARKWWLSDEVGELAS